MLPVTEVLSRSRALAILALRLEPPIEELSPPEARALLRRLIFEEEEAFPILAEQLRRAGRRDEPALGFIATFCDAVRRFGAEDNTLANILDEAGNILEGQEREAELRELCDRFYEAQARLERANETTAMAMVCEALERDEIRREPMAIEDQPTRFPTRVILDRPEALTPLEARLWSAVSQAAELSLAVDASIVALADDESFDPDASIRPSSDFVRGAVRFLRDHSKLRVIPLKEVFPEARALQAALFDGSEPPAELRPGLELWSRHGYREEVAEALDRIREGVRGGLWSYEEVQIAAPKVELYTGLLQEAARDRGIPLAILKGSPVATAPPAVLLKDLLDWCASGASEAALAAFSRPLFLRERPVIKAADFADFRQRHPALEELIAALEERGEFLELSADDEAILEVSRLHSAARKAQIGGGLDFAEDWLAPMALNLRRWLVQEIESLPWIRQVVYDLAALEKVWHQLSPLREPELETPDGLDLVRRLFLEGDRFSAEVMRSFLEAARESEEGGEPLLDAAALADEAFDAIRAFHAIDELFERLREEDRFRRSQGWVEKGLRSLQERILRGLAAITTPRSGERGAVLVSELHEARDRPGLKALFCLGLTASGLAKSERRDDEEQLDAVGELLADGRMRYLVTELGLASENRWTLGRLLREQPRLILSAPRIEDNEESRPAMALADLQRWVEAREGDEERAPVRKTRAKPRRGARAAAVLGARSAPEMTPYDGDLGDLDEEPEAINEYSPTMLEVLADCPHRHFFANMIYLNELPEARDDLPRHEVGTAVHLCLEKFWSHPTLGWKEGPINAFNFNAACQTMLAVAREALEESSIDWERGPLNRHDKAVMIRGLDEPGDEGPRGMLKAALAYQRDLKFLSGPPYKTEMRFGATADKPLSVPITGRVSARGIVDRIDEFQDDEGRVHYLILDYKTGYAKTIRDVENGQAVQIPLYALAAREVFENPEARVRGGLLTLQDPNRRKGRGSEALDHPIYGVYREHIAAVKSKGRWVCTDDEAIVEEGLERFREQVDELDARVRKGHLWQEPSPKACPFCPYQSICFHSEAQVLEKLAGEEGQEAPDPLAFHSSAAAPKLVEEGPAAISAEQQSACDIGASASIAAGAGSGKTFILKTRIAGLIRRGVPVSAILAVTFTDRAAEEIRERVEAALGEALSEPGLDELERQRITRARSELEGASIGTIHAFCHQLIVMDPALTGVDRSFQVASGPLIEELEDRVLRGLFSRRSPVSAEIEALLKAGVSLGSLRYQVRQRFTRGAALEDISASAERPDEEWNQLLPRLWNELLEEELAPLVGELAAWIEDADTWMGTEAGSKVLDARSPRREQFTELLADMRQILRCFEGARWFEGKGVLDERLAIMREHNKALGFTRSKNNPRNFWKELRDRLDGLSCPPLPDAGFSRDWASIAQARAFVTITRAAREAYQARKKELGFLDFDDLIERAHAALVGPVAPELRLRRARLLGRLRQRFQHILVDEFQDTNRRQWEILKALMMQPKARDATGFIVGDAKQSIYGWRGSDNRVFEQARGELKKRRRALSLSLSKNYRSTPGLIAWINAAFDSIFRSELAEDGRKLVETAVAPQAMEATRSSGGSPHLLWIPAASEEEERRSESEVIAALLRSILAGDERFAASPRRGPKIGVLCRTTRGLHELSRAFDRARLPYSSTHRAGFFSREPVLIIETALRALAFDQDDISLAGLLRGPLIGWTDRDLLEAKRALHDASRDERWPGRLRRGDWDDPRARAFLERYRRWKRALAWSRPSGFLRLLLADSGLIEAYEALGDRGSARDLGRLVELIEAAEREQGLGVFDGIRWMETQRRSGLEGAALAPLDDIPIALTTIHGAKGLEFPIVVLPGLGRRYLQDYDFIEAELPGEERLSIGLRSSLASQSSKRCETAISALLQRRNQDQVCSEEKRLFYVACTRAIDHLILPLVSRSSRDRPWLPPETGEDERRQRLAQAKRHRDLITALGQPDDPEDPKRIHFPGPEGPVEVPLWRVEGLRLDDSEE